MEKLTRDQLNRMLERKMETVLNRKVNLDKIKIDRISETNRYGNFLLIDITQIYVDFKVGSNKGAMRPYLEGSIERKIITDQMNINNRI